jgi:DNA repair protein RadC
MIKKEVLKSLKGKWSDYHIKVILERTHHEQRPTISTSFEAFTFIKEVWDKDSLNLQEQFVVVFLNRSNKLIAWKLLNTGCDSSTVVDIKLLVCLCLQCMARSVIICHNHPSGNLRPSRMTRH